MANNKIQWLLVFFLILSLSRASAQSIDSTANEIDLLSDTQAPLGIEKLLLKSNKNKLATQKIFEDIIKRKPSALLIFGDVVALGYQESKWRDMDVYLASARKMGIPVSALLGNHDVMLNAKAGEAAFLKRFPDEVNTGFLKIIDSVAFLMMNSNFKTLSKEQIQEQDNYYTQSMLELDTNQAVKLIIVSCHHAPYTNSKIVGSNKAVQEKFVPLFIRTKKAKFFITGHAHDFEHFKIQDKDFLTIGGGGGLHQPLEKGPRAIPSLSKGYEPEFHYLTIRRTGNQLTLISRMLKTDFSGFENGYRFTAK
jgi:Icc-related predicted phosphoesterase